MIHVNCYDTYNYHDTMQHLRVRVLLEHDRDLAHGGEQREDRLRGLLQEVLLVRARGERVERGHNTLRRVLEGGREEDEAGLRERAGRGAVRRERGSGRGHLVLRRRERRASKKRSSSRGGHAQTRSRTVKRAFSWSGCGSRWQKGVRRAKSELFASCAMKTPKKHDKNSTGAALRVQCDGNTLKTRGNLRRGTNELRRVFRASQTHVS